jgi:maltooligosyltrehalose trehalohydrolase
LSGEQFVVCVQNHDQVGNRAAGDRIGALTSPGRLRVAAALLLCSPFTPMLFQGEEWGATTPFQYFTDHEPALGRVVSEGRRNEFARFGWDPALVPDPQSPSTFAASKLDWSEPGTSPHAELLAWYQLLIALRRQYPELVDPRFERTEVAVDDRRATLTMTRGRARLFVNLGAAGAAFAIEPGATTLASSDTDARRDGDTLVVPPDAVAIVRAPEPSERRG